MAQWCLLAAGKRYQDPVECGLRGGFWRRGFVAALNSTKLSDDVVVVVRGKVVLQKQHCVLFVLGGVLWSHLN